MAESNATQVILTDDGLKIIKAQNTADNAADGITNLNDPNLMSVIEKQNNIGQFAGLTSQYNIIVQNAKDDGIDTTALTVAYNNLNQFMASVLADPDHASDIDRVTYKKYQDAYNEELANLQNALQNNANNKFTSAASATSQAASTASQAFSQANSAIGVANGATAKIAKLSGDINLRVTKDGLIDQINIQAGNTLISSSGQLTLSGKTIYFDTDNPVIIPSANITGTLTGKKLEAANIAANTFTTNNGTFTVYSNGAITAKNMTLIGGTLTSPTINASTINSSTVNGTTFHGGDIINDANNTFKFYPTTISSDGHIYTTRFNPVDAMQTDLSTGALTTKYRAINTTNPNNHYEAYDTTLQADQIALFAGYTNGKDMSFTQSVTGSNQEGYVLISPLDGLTLHGDNQQITFNGTSDDVTPKGIFITPYGNINPNGTQNIWYVGNNMNMKTASFGIDGSGTYNIQFNRELDIGNFHINTYHTFTSADGAPIHFAKGQGGAADIYAGNVHYDSLVKSSLLSVKWDVQKADTAYWAQLVNSIDLATYQYKTDDNTSHLRLSSIVDDVNVTKQWQLPDVFISRDEDGKLCGVDDSVLLNATLATVQEQQKEIDQLNGHNMELEARLNKLEVKLNG